MLKEVKLEQAIRYSDGDEVESWLNRLLMLDSTESEPIYEGYPHPSELELYYINRDTLFSFHKTSEGFLKKLMSLFVSSHYKNSPNDLQLLSDAPAHGIFALCKSLDKAKGKSIPDIYAAIQICEEGGIDKNVILNNNKRGFKPAGDLIPWTLSDYFQDNEFPLMSGIRVVRIATHPDCQRMGYGTRALELLCEYYEGKMVNLDMEEDEPEEPKETSDEIKPKKKLKPLLAKLTDVKPPKINYIGTSFGLTSELFNFWKKNDFYPLYLKLTENDITGEHSCIMLRAIKDDEIKTIEGGETNWIIPYANDFKKRMTTLLGSNELKNLNVKLALSLLDPQLTTTTNMDKDDDKEYEESKSTLQKIQLDVFITNQDFKRMQSYTNNINTFTNIMDLLDYLAKFFFLNKFKEIRLSYTQAAILLGYGIQKKSLDIIRDELELKNKKLTTDEMLALFFKIVKKFTTAIRKIYEKEVEDKPVSGVSLPTSNIAIDLHEDLEEESKKIKKKDKEAKHNYNNMLKKKRNHDS